MKKLLLIFLPLGVSFFMLFTPAYVLGVDVLKPVCTGSAQSSGVCVDNQVDKGNPLFGPSGLITRAVQVLAFLVGIAAVVTLIIAGLRFVLSSGDPSTTSTARNAIIYAVIGLVVALTAQAMVTFVLSKINV